jgi:Xaa-Pro dipeptidase
MILANLGLDGGKRDLISADMLKTMRMYDGELVPSRLKSGRERQTLKPNMIVTVEPGM